MFTPTAAELRAEMAPELELPSNMQCLIAETIKQGIAASMQQNRRVALVASRISLQLAWVQNWTEHFRHPEWMH